MSGPPWPAIGEPQITIEVRRMVNEQWIVSRKTLGLRDWIISMQPSGMSDKLIHEALGEIGWRP